jgi:hypothetical protein
MKTFRCGVCDQVLYFEGTQCVNCGSKLCFLPDSLKLSAVEELPAVAGQRAYLKPLGKSANENARYTYCRNHESGGCNWGVPVDPSVSSANGTAADGTLPALDYCEACALNELVPDLSDEVNVESWKTLEAAKRRLLYSLRRLGLRYAPKASNPDDGLAFKFMKDGPTPDAKVLTGHADGVITINISEADPSWRERMRIRLGEAYRTVLGHFRHESGHYYWDRLVKDSAQLDEFRKLFGDERADYSAALSAHYSEASAGTRKAGFISSYAEMHPWEDWAETWAHYLHMVDTLETAHEYGLVITANVGAPVDLGYKIDITNFDELMRLWMPVTLALNSLNRSMGHLDPYPFTIDQGIVAKLTFVHRIVTDASKQESRKLPAKPIMAQQLAAV